ncbi:hypothetical protein [Paraburkholderia sp. EG304]|uniref:hypothetical protein n=1 Tax=Paraburkholderia sp. EG304 TaxID=3237015 RepID=UPI00397C5924
MTRATNSLCVVMLYPVMLAGCASTAREAAFRHQGIALFDARQQASVRCEPRGDREAVWTRTHAFIAKHSASRIVRADDTPIEIPLPHSFGFVYLGMLKEPADEDQTLIQLRAICRGMYDTDGRASLLYSTCADAIVAVDDEFRAFMSAAKYELTAHGRVSAYGIIPPNQSAKRVDTAKPGPLTGSGRRSSAMLRVESGSPSLAVQQLATSNEPKENTRHDRLRIKNRSTMACASSMLTSRKSYRRSYRPRTAIQWTIRRTTNSTPDSTRAPPAEQC